MLILDTTEKISYQGDEDQHEKITGHYSLFMSWYCLCIYTCVHVYKHLRRICTIIIGHI